MNRPIRRLFAVFALLVALLLAYTTRWTVFEAKSLRANALNRRSLLEEQHIPRGPIVAADGNRPWHAASAGPKALRRVYPTGELFAHPVGYHFTDLGNSGIEAFENSALSGQTHEGVQSLLDQLQGIEPVGEKVVTTLDPAAQRVAMQQLGAYHGAVVALEPHTGAVEVMASSPSYNPNVLREPGQFSKLATDNQTAPLINRATQFGYAPGSTFKVVTATAAIDSGKYTKESLVNGKNGIRVGRAARQRLQPELRRISLRQAMAQSVNTVWAQVAEHVGKPTMQRYMDALGLTPNTARLPRGTMSASGIYLGENLLEPTSSLVDIGRVGIGQGHLEATAMQMAQVASAVADRGVLMRPHLTDKVVNHEGQVVRTVEPSVQSDVMKRSTAEQVREMMEAVVNEGTGTPAQIPGVQDRPARPGPPKRRSAARTTTSGSSPLRRRGRPASQSP